MNDKIINMCLCSNANRYHIIIFAVFRSHFTASRGETVIFFFISEPFLLPYCSVVDVKEVYVSVSWCNVWV